MLFIDGVYSHTETIWQSIKPLIEGVEGGFNLFTRIPLKLSSDSSRVGLKMINVGRAQDVSKKAPGFLLQQREGIDRRINPLFSYD